MISRDDAWAGVCTHTVNGASTSDVTLESILAMKRQLEAKTRGHNFDVLVCLPGAQRELRKCTVEEAIITDWFYGVPVYYAHTSHEAGRIVADLKAKGKRSMVVAGPGDPENVPNLPPPLFVGRADSNSEV